MKPGFTPSEQLCAILVLSCDAYADTWAGFFKLLERYWPDCPFNVYLGTDSLRPSIPGCRVLNTKQQGLPWTSCAAEYLKQIPNAFVLTLLDDFYFRSRIDTNKVRQLIQTAHEKAYQQLRMVAIPGPASTNVASPVGPLSGEYRVSTQCALWDRKHLISILQTPLSIWEFEKNASNSAAGNYVGVYRDVILYRGLLTHHVIEKGCWIPHEVLRLRWLEGIRVEKRRPLLPLKYYSFYMMATLTSRLLRRTSAGKQIKDRIKQLALRLMPLLMAKLGGPAGRK